MIVIAMQNHSLTSHALSCKGKALGVCEPVTEAQEFAKHFEAVFFNINCIFSAHVTKYCTVIGHTTVQCGTVHEIHYLLV